MSMILSSQVGPPPAELPSCCGSKMLIQKVLRTEGHVYRAKCTKCPFSYLLAAPPHKKKTAGVQGSVCVELIHAETKEVVRRVTDHNVFTDVGRNYLASLVSYSVFSQTPGVDEPSTSKRRYDGVRYMMVGTGTQLETASVSGLVTPVAFNASGDYLAQISAPNELPGVGISALFQRVYGVNEISIPSTVNITEVGLFPSGPTSSPLSPSSGIHPPIAYKTFSAIPKTTDFLFSVRWEIKF